MADRNNRNYNANRFNPLAAEQPANQVEGGNRGNGRGRGRGRGGRGGRRRGAQVQAPVAQPQQQQQQQLAPVQAAPAQIAAQPVPRRDVACDSGKI